MKKQRFVLTYIGKGDMPSSDVTFFQTQITVLDQSRCCLLVEDSADHLGQLLQHRPDWQGEPEQMFKTLNG